LIVEVPEGRRVRSEITALRCVARCMQDLVRRSMSRTTFKSFRLTIAVGVAFALAAIGFYGVVTTSMLGRACARSGSSSHCVRALTG
jgi:hypothetical protein